MTKKNSAPATKPTSSEPEATTLWWIGVLPNCPINGVTIAGLAFCKHNETGQPGDVLPLTAEQVRLLAEKLPYRILRFVNYNPAKAGPMHAMLLSIPTPEEREAVRQKRGYFREFLPTKADRPLAQFLYAVPIPGNKIRQKPEDEELPPPLIKTGLPPHGDVGPEWWKEEKARDETSMAQRRRRERQMLEQERFELVQERERLLTENRQLKAALLAPVTDDISEASFCQFVSRFRDRLKTGAKNYGDGVFSWSVNRLVDEIQQELEDVSGWSFVLWLRLERLRALGDELSRREPGAVKDE